MFVAVGLVGETVGETEWRTLSPASGIGFAGGAGFQSSLADNDALGSCGRCSGGLERVRIWRESAAIELMPLNLRGDKGEVRPFTAVNAGTNGSPDFSLNMKFVGLINGA